MANGAYIRVALSNNSDFMCFQKTPRGLYLGQCLVTLSVSRAEEFSFTFRGRLQVEHDLPCLNMVVAEEQSS